MNIYAHAMRSSEEKAAQTIGDFVYNGLSAGTASDSQ